MKKVNCIYYLSKNRYPPPTHIHIFKPVNKIVYINYDIIFQKIIAYIIICYIYYKIYVYYLLYITYILHILYILKKINSHLHILYHIYYLLYILYIPYIIYNIQYIKKIIT